MGFSFSPDLSDALSRVRQYVGDVDATDYVVEDETITAYLTGRSDLAVAAQVARDLASRFARKIDSTVDGASQRNSQLYAHYLQLADSLDRQAGAQVQAATQGGFTGVGVYGATASEVYAAREDCTLARNARLPWG